MTSLREWTAGRRNTVGSNTYRPWPPYEVREPLNFFALLNEGLKRNPPQGPDLVMLGLFESLNIGPNKTFDPTTLDAATAAGLRRAVEIGPANPHRGLQREARSAINNWQITTDLGSWQTPDTGQLDFLLRSAIAKEAQPGQNAAEAMYPMAFSDADGLPLTGVNRYVLRFEKVEMPPVNAFWSVTLYDATGFMIASAINRTQIGTYDKLVPDDDGSTTIYIQRETPGKDKENNWLPAPEGPFNLGLRLYNPGPAALTLDWAPPAVRRQ